jgi:hypothetical protein
MESKKFISKAGDFIATNKKPLLYVGGAILIVAIGYTIVKKFQGGFGSFLKDKSVGAKEFTPVKVDATKSTISNEEANNFANQLFNAMDNYGTNEDVIYDILNKLQKKDDFRKVYNAFGRKSYYIDGSPTISAYIFGYNNLDLIEWFNEEVGWSNPLTKNLINKTVKNANL